MPHCEKNCITLLLTEKCNLDCKYCYCDKSNRKSESIDVSFAKKGIEDFYRKYGNIYLRFFGNGEPTLEFDKMVEITKYARGLDKYSNIELQTNGFFNKDICKWVGENINIVWISCDGPSDIHDYYRPTMNGDKSSMIIEENIKYLYNKIDKLGARPTIGQKNIWRQKDIIDYFNNLGIKYIYTVLMFASINGEYFESEIPRMEYAKQFVEAMNYAKKKGIFYGSFFTMNFDGKSNISCRSCIPSPHLTIDGFVSCCDMAYSKETFPELLYGKYNPNTNEIIYDEQKINFVKSRTVENLPECNDCEIKYYCAGGCIGESLYEKGSIFKIKRENCDTIKFLAKEIGVEKGKFPVFHP